MLASDRELPVSGGPEKRAYVRDVFTAIAPTYDRLNRIISLRFDQGWRRYAVGRLGWERRPDGIYLDLCAGTLDFAATLARRPGFRGRIVAADFVPAMLRLGRDKAKGLAPVTADALDLPFPDASFDGAMVGWGVRNLVDLDAGLAEAARVLRPGSRLVILEMTLPPQPGLRRLYEFYFRRVMPWIGRRISKHTTAYTWLPASTMAFPSPPELARRLAAQGFDGVSYRLFMGGVCALHVGTRVGGMQPPLSHPERSEGAMPRGMPPSLRSG
jgi:demethylmenaquinone methyltransferase/2-methoxy-6-polyprenyl-1,4-benzoquinol methylase